MLPCKHEPHSSPEHAKVITRMKCLPMMADVPKQEMKKRTLGYFFLFAFFYINILLSFFPGTTKHQASINKNKVRDNSPSLHTGKSHQNNTVINGNICNHVFK